MAPLISAFIDRPCRASAGLARKLPSNGNGHTDLHRLGHSAPCAGCIMYGNVTSLQGFQRRPAGGLRRFAGLTARSWGNRQEPLPGLHFSETISGCRSHTFLDPPGPPPGPRYRLVVRLHYWQSRRLTLRLTRSLLQPSLSQTSTNVAPFAFIVLAKVSGWTRGMVRLLRGRC